SYKLLKKFQFKNIDDILNEINIKLKDFNVLCKIKDNNIDSQDLKLKVTSLICEKYKTKPDYKEPKDILYIDIIKNTCLLGLNPEINLFKRPYKIRTSNNSLNACLASSLLILSDFKKTESLLDPFCNDATLLIEAALKGSKNLYGLDSRSVNINNARINSQIAKVKINLENKTINSFNTKIDRIITQTPFPSKLKSEKLIGPILENFLEKAYNLLEKSLTIITQNPSLLLKLAEKNFNLIKKLEVKHGSQNYFIFIFNKKE
ncbi:hypothetical protein FJZ17_04515, partial [Candidatus Pacearchaeota archaeon]|nr:hypothetical protein [Candidatus Pacearchaeota archaeon]